MIETSEIIIRLVVGAFCGALIGIERERKEWTAGMRTHMMVSVGATLYMIVSAYAFEEILHHDNVSLDPSRIASQVVSGIGFIGAGTIMFLRQGVIRGLTTASGLWTVAGIGLAIGGGMYYAGIATTIIAIVILWILQPIEAMLYRRTRTKTLIVTVRSPKDSAAILDSILSHSDLSLHAFSMDNAKEAPELRITSNKAKDIQKIAVFLKGNETVQYLHWEG